MGEVLFSKETAIPFLVPTLPERKHIPVTWVISRSLPPLLTQLCRSAGPQLRAGCGAGGEWVKALETQFCRLGRVAWIRDISEN